jgi:glycosyltransferase involved in cell wall biosynthesis
MPQAMSVPSVRYWVFNYMPEWEAVSKEIASLLEGLGEAVDGSLVSLNTTDRRLRLGGRLKRVPLPYGLPLYPLLVPHAARADVNHLFASASERWLSPLLAQHNGVLTIAKGSGGFERIERNTTALRRYRAIVVQCERDRDLMRQVGVPEAAIRLIRPGIPLAAYREGRGPFTILFASSPLSEGDFLTRGIHLIVRAAVRLPDVRFLLVWRRRHLGKLQRLIADAGAYNIDVLDGVIPDMGEVYDRVHATILPALEHHSLIAAPRSGLESLAHGKPLLVSQQVPISRSLGAAGAGVVFEPTLEGLEFAVRQLRRNYDALQQGTHAYLRERFSPSTHLELHRRLYQALVR